MISAIFHRNKQLAWMGVLFFLMSVGLAVMIPSHTTEVLGVNALYKPLKFAISIGVFCWTMAYLMHYFEDKVSVKRLSAFIVFTMLFEQGVILTQALRGTLSHFNKDTTIEKLLFLFMGIFITLMTVWIVRANFKFNKQEDELPKTIRSSIFLGINIFAFAGLIGGVMGGMFSHSIGGEMGGEGLPFVNWSTEHGDMRAGHFIGLHALQVIPLVGFGLHKYIPDSERALKTINSFSFLYFLFVVLTFGQAILGLPIW